MALANPSSEENQSLPSNLCTSELAELPEPTGLELAPVLATEGMPPVAPIPPQENSDRRISPDQGLEEVSIEYFTQTYPAYLKSITNFIRRLVGGNQELANDFAADIFMRTYKALANGRKIQVKGYVSWLYRAAINRVKDHIRHEELICWLPLDEELLAIEHHETLDSKSQRTTRPSSFERREEDFTKTIADLDLVQSILNRMRPMWATALFLFAVEGFSHTEIAETLHISVSASKMFVMRGKAAFLAEYQKANGSVEENSTILTATVTTRGGKAVAPPVVSSSRSGIHYRHPINPEDDPEWQAVQSALRLQRLMEEQAHENINHSGKRS